MAQWHRLTIRSIDRDPRATRIGIAASQLGIADVDPERITVADVMFLQGDLTIDELERLEQLLVDPLLQTGSWHLPTGTGTEIALLPGVTDRPATVLMHAAARLGIALGATTTARRIEFGDDVHERTVAEIIARVVANPVIERWTHGPIDPVVEAGATAGTEPGAAARIALSGLTADDLVELGRHRSLALDPEELVAIQRHFDEIGRNPTDVELEMLAQTWSEHCAHKTFRAELVCDDGIERPTLLAMLQRCTADIDAPFVRSAFVGNAGIVGFDGTTTLALKAETHNHPSAVEPFGGANTGVGGVIRDVLGAAHRPIAVTDVLCFGPPELAAEDVPAGTLHPARIRDGVIDGVADYGNKIGLAIVAGAILHDPGYTATPLVFAGCIGAATDWAPHPGPFPDDRVVVLGGRTGRDGIRGATFSSLTMDATTGSVAGASVQIGDPVVERLLIDVLDGAEHLYTAVTDCGAGGLSSAIGEMAEGVGADVELAQVPLKYVGLEPWEIWLSEAQERMVVAVPPSHVAEFSDRCRRHGVELADLGRFTGDGIVTVRSGGVPVVRIPTSFLHDGRPTRRMLAAMPTPNRGAEVDRRVDDPRALLLELLAHRNIASVAPTVHRYDHEIGGSTVVRPLVGVGGDGPADGVVLAGPDSTSGVAIGIGVNPWWGMHDPWTMAHGVVDEAIRQVVAVGGDPDRVALLDNFSWGDPLRPSTLGELVAAVEGCCAAATAHRAPFVSGKDSLNNEHTGDDGVRRSVPPTLVVTAVAHVPDVDRCTTPTLASPGNLLLLLGATRTEFAGSHLDLVLGEPADPGSVPRPDPRTPGRLRRLHRAILDGLVRSCHDVSEGGLAVALAEMCIAGRLGITVTELPHDRPTTALFAESPGRFVVEIEPADLDAFVGTIEGDTGDRPTVIGCVVGEPTLSVPGLAPLHLDELRSAHFRTGRPA